VFKLIEAPDEIITLEEVAGFIRAEFSSSEESFIRTLIKASRISCEEYLFRRIGMQTVELRTKGFPENNAAIVLPAPIIEVESVKYLDLNGDEQTLAESSYVVSDSAPCFITPVGTWPVALVSGDSLRVRFDAGYTDPGDSPVVPETLPETIRIGMLMQIADLYENREAQSERPLNQNQTLVNLLSPYRLEMGF